MRKALAQVAASTVHPDHAQAEASETEVAVEASAPTTASAPQQRSGRSRGSRGGANKQSVPAEAVEVAAILDIPVIDLAELDGAAANSRAPRRAISEDAEHILDAVLDALPEPKQPGQGRSRVSRRATSSGSGIITTGPTE
jgi:ribonuclease E